LRGSRSFICLSKSQNYLLQEVFQETFINGLSFKELMNKPGENEEQQIIRVRIPQGKEILGIVQQRLGGSRMRVLCLDSKERICRIPGRLRRALWVREGDVVIIEPWELGGDEKGDVIHKYRGKAEVDFLKKKGYLKNIEDEF